MARRKWTPQDPEPDDHPPVVDSFGDVYLWLDDDGWGDSGWFCPHRYGGVLRWDQLWDAEESVDIFELLDQQEVDELLDGQFPDPERH